MGELNPVGAVEQFTPRPYQQEAADFIAGNRRVIIADEMGLGKTGEVYEGWKRLGFPVPALLVAGKNAQYGWHKYAPNWGCPQPTIITGTGLERREMWANYGGNPHKFVACTREVLKRDYKRGWVPRQWAVVIVDECHRDMNRKTQNHAALKWLKSQCFIFVTGSPRLERGPHQMWSLLHVLYPHKYRSYWRFVDQYCWTQTDELGHHEILGGRNLMQLARELTSIFLRRTKHGVLPDLPPKVRDLSHVLELTEEQRGIYNQLVEASVAELSTVNGGMVIAPTVLARLVRLRQLLVCPRMLDPELGDGAAIDHLVELLEDTEDHHMVVFTPFTKAIPFIAERLWKEGHRSIINLQGGLDIDELGKRLESFRRDRGICICSTLFAESFDLVPASWGYFLGYEWDANVNFQAEDRLHRMTITNPVNLYYPQHQGCIDQQLIMPALDVKSNNLKRILSSFGELQRILKKV